MLTARAEFRLSLRADNAETRLGEIALAAGALGPARAVHQRRRREVRMTMREALAVESTASQLAERGAAVAQDGARRSAFDWMRTPGVGLDHVLPDQTCDWPAAIVDELTEDARYAPYLERQAADIARMRQDEGRLLPADIAYAAVAGLSAEMIGRLEASRPATIAAASRIRGITPAALSAIHLHMMRAAA